MRSRFLLGQDAAHGVDYATIDADEQVICVAVLPLKER
jgi:hypothetical protein